MPTEAADTKKQALCCEGKLGELYAAAEDCARREPLKCAALTFFAGMLLAVLPVGRIVATLVRLAFAFVRPGLMLLGAVKAAQEIENRRLK